MSAFYWKLDSVGNIFSSGDYLVEVDEMYRPNSENLEGKNSFISFIIPVSKQVVWYRVAI